MKNVKPVTRPFHQTFLEGIKQTHDVLLGANHSIDDFVFLARFRIELRPILSVLEQTTIPEDEIENTIKGLNSFRSNFLAKLGEIPFMTSQEEVNRILAYFESAINNLKSRL